ITTASSFFFNHLQIQWVAILVVLSRSSERVYGHLKKMKSFLNTLPDSALVAGVLFLNTPFFPSSSSSMPMTAAELEQAFHANNGGLILSSSSSMDTGSFLTKSACDPLFLVEFQSDIDPITYNSNLLSQYQQTGYDTSLPNLASFSDHSGSKMNTTTSFIMNEARDSSSTTNSSQMNNSLSAGFQQMTFEGEMFHFNGVNVKSEEGCIGQWEQQNMHEVQVNNASDFNMYPMGSLSGEYTDVFHQI
ncbi:hypothetical protein Ccrd_022824, partial [Cynara cardunculus var. scolymus]